MMRKGMAQSQIFIFMLGIIVVSMTLLLGYKVIGSVQKTMSSSAINDVKLAIEGHVNDISNEYGSVRKERISVPGKVKFICFASSTVTTEDPAGFTEGIDKFTEIPSKALRAIRDSLSDGVEANVFLVTDNMEKPFYVENLETSPYKAICIPNNGGVNIVLRGFGNKAVLDAGCPNGGECLGGMTCDDANEKYICKI